MKSRRDTGGFTLIEVVIAIALVAIMAAAIGPMAIRQINRVREKATLTELEEIRSALLSYFEDTGTFPVEGTNLAGLVSDDGRRGWSGPYLEYVKDNPVRAVSTDAFGEQYIYDLAPSVVPPGGIDLIVASLGANRNQELGAGAGNWQLGDLSNTDDLILTVSMAGINRSKRQESEEELEELATAVRRYYYQNSALPTDLADLNGTFIDSGVEDDAFTDGWHHLYFSSVSTDAQPIFSIWSSGPDQGNDAGGDDDILIEIDSSTLSSGTSEPTETDWSDEGAYSEYLVSEAQKALDANPGLKLKHKDLKHYLEDLGLSEIFEYDDWGKKLVINKDTRQVFSCGPDGKDKKTEDNIPPGVGP